MAKPGFMSESDAERAIWGFYWQLDNSRDRRTAPLILDPSEKIEEELEQRDRYTGLWGKVQRQVDRWFGASKRKSAEENALRDVFEELGAEDASAPGRLDPNTGLPVRAADLASGRSVVTGTTLCMEAIIPPDDLAAATTAWLPPCPPEEKPETWGDDPSHWQVLAYKPKEIHCDTCSGSGRVREQITHEARGQFRFRVDGKRFRWVNCWKCSGKGTVQNWDDDEVEAVRHNAHLIKRKVHELAAKGLFDKRPVNPRDVEMSDLVWEDGAGFTIGFKLTWEGYQYMKQYCAKDTELQQSIHVLLYAGHEVRENAPEWAREEFKNRPAIQVSSGGFQATTGGFQAATGGGFNQ